jgi:hypothetical protein
MGIAVVSATEETPGEEAMRFKMSCSMRITRSGSFTCVEGIEMRSVCTLVRAGESGIDVAQRLERADHEAGTDQQDQRQRHLHDHQNAARAMPVFTLAERAAPAAQRAGNLRARVFENRNQPKTRPAASEMASVKASTHGVDGDIFDTRQMGQAGGGEQRSAP